MEEDYLTTRSRLIVSGGWDAAKIESRRWGKWCQFYDPKSKQTINQVLPVDYQKKYVPPLHQTPPPEYSRHEKDFFFDSPDFVIPLTTRELRIPLDITPERLPEVEHEENRKNKTNTISSERKPRAKTHLKKKKVLKANYQEPNHVINVDKINLPRTPRVIKKVKGDDPKKFPIRVSTLYLKELSDFSRTSRISTRKEESELHVTGYSPRPKTSLH